MIIESGLTLKQPTRVMEDMREHQGGKYEPACRQEHGMGTLQYVLKVKPSRHSSVGRVSHTLRQWQHDRFWFQAPPMPARRYMEENGSATMLVAMRSAGDTLELSLMQCVTYMPRPSANNAAHSGFEVQWRKDLCPPKIIQKLNSCVFIICKLLHF